MKPSVPEKGVVIRLKKDLAIVMIEKGKACRGCGAGKIGLCRAGGDAMMLTASNPLGARIGDVVEVGVSEAIKTKGYLLAYVLPLVAFLSGAVVGHIAGIRHGITWLDVAAGFGCLLLTSLVTYTLLRRLDRSSKLEIKRIIRDGEFCLETPSDEERYYSGSAGVC